MIDRAEKAGFGIALTGHAALFALLSLGLVSTAKLPPLVNEPMDVILTDEVGLRSAFPTPSVEAPAPSEAPELGVPEEPAPAEPEPVPAPEPAAKPKASDVPQVPKPADKPKPAEKPQPTPKKEEQDMGDRRRPDRDAKGKAEKPAGSRLGANFLNGIGDDPKGTAKTPRAAVSGAAMQGLAAALARQFKPCYELGSLQGTSAMSIVTVLRLRYKADGSVAVAPEVVEQTGINDGNRSYARQMSDVARRAVLRCTPVKLPANLYEGGWDDFQLRFIPSQMG
ncbi:Cell division and transport-associated protein TolA [Sphingomonas laterariae]|uniref:Cell division and transport-associated protein TolA n=1 Tax=Edaphosphingomonas laterariae TaxID=861865 RepID=A0A239FV25_9SPHN|nr:hypothetical protein [Sphingomonas laterariae]SNS60877.1 Cell division and transport-associated protein TolA [Sphingomonas laterariae]